MYGPHGELFFFLVKKEPMVLSELVEFGRSAVQPLVSAETLKACALIGLHLLAAEGDADSRLSRKPGVDGSCSANETSLVVRCISNTTSAGPLKSSGRIGQARWWRSAAR